MKTRGGRPRRYRVAAAVGAVLALAALIAEGRRRQGLYWYPVRADYAYVFGDAVALPVEIGAAGVRLPALEGTWDTALLRLEVDATLAGAWYEPAIEFSCSEASGRQYFERRARGARYLDLSPCLAGRRWGGGSRVGLRAHQLEWPARRGELLLFRNPEISGRTILVVAPHPDDAEIAAFGLYRDRDAWVVTVSAGNYDDARLAALLPDPRERELTSGRLRTWDSLVVPSWAGVPPSRALNLGYFNGALEAMHSDPEAIVADDSLGSADIAPFRSLNLSPLLEDRAPVSSWRSLVADLEAVMESIDPQIVVAPHPVLDASPDHRYATIALFEALDRVDSQPALFLYANHHVGSEYFPFGPAEGVVGPGPWFDAELPVGGVYSHSLDHDTRVAKLFALDAMHDLRPAPVVREPGPWARIAGRLTEVAAELARDPVDSYSYYRRAVRPNELFWTYGGGGRRTLTDYLERRGR